LTAEYATRVFRKLWADVDIKIFWFAGEMLPVLRFWGGDTGLWLWN